MRVKGSFGKMAVFLVVVFMFSACIAQSNDSKSPAGVYSQTSSYAVSTPQSEASDTPFSSAESPSYIPSEEPPNETVSTPWRPSGIVAVVDGQEISISQYATAPQVALAVGNEDTMQLRFLGKILRVWITYREKSGEEFMIYWSNEDTSSPPPGEHYEAQWAAPVPQAPGTYETFIRVNGFGKSSGDWLGPTFVIGDGKTREQDPSLPSMLTNALTTVYVSRENSPLLQWNALLDAQVYLQAMHLVPIEQAVNPTGLPIEHPFVLTLENSSGVQAAFSFETSGVYYNGQTYYPQNLAALEGLLSADMSGSGFLHFDYQPLKGLLPFGQEDMAKAHFFSGGAKGYSQSEDIDAGGAYEQIANLMVYIWPENMEIPGNNRLSGYQEWTVTLKNGQEYIIHLDKNESFLQYPNGEQILFLYAEDLAYIP